jgi:hypothetical protein
VEIKLSEELETNEEAPQSIETENAPEPVSVATEQASEKPKRTRKKKTE